MKKIFDFLKRNSWIWVIVIVLIAIIGDAYLTNKSKPAATPTPVPITASFKSITPGISSESDLNKVLGTPIKTTINGNEKTDEYKSTSELRFHTALIESGKVIFIREIVSAHDSSKASDIISVYGKPPYTLYSKSPNASYNLYVYPTNGIAYIGHPDGTLLEIWYFVPTSITNFSTAWAPEYIKTPTTEIVQ